MKIVQAAEAKAKFSALLSDVERGEVVGITRHGRTVARLVPEENFKKQEIGGAIADLRKLRASLPKAGITVEDILTMRHEGHKY